MKTMELSKTPKVICAILIVLLGVSTTMTLGGETWPTWRGPNMNGIASGGNPPLKWSESENIKWKIKLTGDESNSSPVIWGDKIFFQAAVETKIKDDTPTSPSRPQSGGGGRRRGGRSFGGSAPTTQFKFNLVCLDRKTGKTLWEETVCQVKPHQGHHNDHGFASFSPVTDGELVWAAYGSRGIYCYDVNGKKIWNKELPTLATMFGEGGSPALAGNAVIVTSDQQGESFIFAFDKKTGDLLWKKARDEDTSYATPLPVMVDGKLQVIANATNFVRSYDAKTGEVIWQCSGQTRNVIPTPVTGFGMVYCTSGFRGSTLQAIKLGRTGDLTNTDAIVWQVNENTPYVPSPLLYDGRIYVCRVNQEVISCYDAQTGKPHFVKQTLDEIKGIYASPTAAGGRIYFVGRNGVSTVLKPSDQYEVLATNTLDDKFDCSPAFVGDEMYLKGKQNLYCIAALN
jgi:outer membrane protein assembly factor BamB